MSSILKRWIIVVFGFSEYANVFIKSSSISDLVAYWFPLKWTKPSLLETNSHLNFLGLKIPLSKKEKVKNSYYLSAYNEIFLNAKTSIYDRNRLYGGLGYNLNSTIRFEAGYMNQFFETSSRDQFNLIAFVTF